MSFSSAKKMQTSAMKAGFQIAECSFSSAKIAKKKQIKQGCFKQSCLKPAFLLQIHLYLMDYG